MTNKKGIKEKEEETYSYKGWLISDSFLKRAFAVYGYSLVAGLIISLIVMIPLIILFFIFGLLFAI